MFVGQKKDPGKWPCVSSVENLSRMWKITLSWNVFHYFCFEREREWIQCFPFLYPTCRQFHVHGCFLCIKASKWLRVHNGHLTSRCVLARYTAEGQEVKSDSHIRCMLLRYSVEIQVLTQFKYIPQWPFQVSTHWRYCTKAKEIGNNVQYVCIYIYITYIYIYRYARYLQFSLVSWNGQWMRITSFHEIYTSYSSYSHSR